ncbi:hypothetical protein PILCRDRAFT_91517 [Piloderma croceum F 1598]|uniref:DDE-1 domain-containing protein n=1 Tax=Piloderma croceum (strain F 1598) TaxID=765440 RepID=A0A0C3BGZ1_PILCF|nr:hypothetical protein PILCRDRAFT_91517 [Piloderma croceum F 1598]
MQANDGLKAGWVLEGEQPLKKKGPGRGLHQSDVICSTVGWLLEASQTLKYGKNYDGYWTGELFIKQLVEKIIPAFENAHSLGYQALIMVDNSQGHSAYPVDALHVSEMNLRPGGKQCCLCNGWFIHDGQRVTQPMIFSPDHPKFPDAPKRIKQVLEERGLWQVGMHLECAKPKCLVDATSCFAKCVLGLQPDFTEQKSLVQEVIEAVGHMCIFLSKFYYNLLKALASVDVKTIWQWEHQMIQWMDAYREGKGIAPSQSL